MFYKNGNNISTMFFLIMISSFVGCGESNFKGNIGKKITQDSNLATAQRSEVFTGTRPEAYAVDIIFLLDSSDSMSRYRSKVSENLSHLINSYLKKVQNLDYQIFIVSKNVHMPIADDQIYSIDRNIGSHNALVVAQELIAGDTAVGSGKIRKDAVKELVVVSDDDSRISSDEFMQWMDENKEYAKSVHVNGIISFEKGSWLTHGYNSNPGKMYMELAKRERTRGVIANLASPNWQQVFDQLGRQLLEFKTDPQTKINLDGRPASSETITVLINGTAINTQNWEYDSSQNVVIILQNTTDSDRIEIRYD